MTGKAVAFPRLFKKGWGKNGPEQSIKSIKVNGRKRRSTDDRIRPGSDFLPDRKVDLPGERLLALYLNVNGNHKMIINKLFPQETDLGVDIHLL